MVLQYLRCILLNRFLLQKIRKVTTIVLKNEIPNDASSYKFFLSAEATSDT